MSSISQISTMKAKVLVIMATKAEDQSLVSQVANTLGVKLPILGLAGDLKDLQISGRIIPSFGWHPWYSHQVYDDNAYNGKQSLSISEKIDHYKAALRGGSYENHAFFLALPNPRPLSALIDEMQNLLDQHPLALVGEIGLDKSFRIPELWTIEEAEHRDASLTPGGREGRHLSPYHVDMRHQQMLLSAQLALAGSKRRAVSVHGVGAHGILFDTLKESWTETDRELNQQNTKSRINSSLCHAHGGENKEIPPHELVAGAVGNTEARVERYPPRICLHSYSGPPELVRQYLKLAVPVDFFFSFTELINFSASGKKAEMSIKCVPNENILVESDMHTAGREMDANLERVIKRICLLKNWDLRDGVQQLGSNWKRFVLGHQSSEDKEAEFN